MTGKIFTKINELNDDNSIKKFFYKINLLLDTYAPLKRAEKSLNLEAYKNHYLWKTNYLQISLPRTTL